MIISASRRTDLPGFHGEETARLIRGKIARLRTRFLYGVVFWTRHARPFLDGGPLRELVSDEIANPLINLTVTGLGGTALEPGAPPTDAIAKDIPSLVSAFKAEPWRIRWRFDPILKGHSSIADFEKIGKVMTDNGVKTCTFSFPSYFSLKGSLVPQFQRAGIDRWTEPEKARFMEDLCRCAKSLGVELASCAQPENTAAPIAPDWYQVKEAACIDRDLLERGHPEGLPLNLPKDRSQRGRCNCIQSDDIGDYVRHLCNGGCAYCYSKAGGPDATKGNRPFQGALFPR